MTTNISSTGTFPNLLLYALKTISDVGLKKTVLLLILTIVDKKDGSVCVLLFERLPDSENVDSAFAS